MDISGRHIELLDAFAVVLALWFLIRGIWKGFVWQVAGLAIVIGGLLAARRLSDDVAAVLQRWFPEWLKDTNFAIVVAWVSVFVGVTLLVWAVARLLQKLIDGLRLQSFDRTLGGVFGLLKALAVLVALVSLLSLIHSAPIQQQIAKAYSGRVADFALEKGAPLFPEEVRSRIRDLRRWVEDGIDGGSDASPPEPDSPAAEGERSSR